MMEKGKKRKPYPAISERIMKAEQKIARLERLNANREVLIQETEDVLRKRREALEGTKMQYASTVALRDKLIALSTNPLMKRGIRATKVAEKAKYEELKEKLAAQGKTLDDLLNSM